MFAPLALLTLLAPLGAGCESTPPASDTDAGIDASMEVVDAGTDAGPPDPDVCGMLSLPTVPMREGTGNSLGEVAGDFTVHELDGRVWRLSDHWSGCESYVFLNYIPDLRATPSGPWEGDVLFGTTLDTLFNAGGRNTQYFFTSFEETESARVERMNALRATLEEGLGLWLENEEDRELWRTRFHFVVDRATEIEGSPGAYLNDYMAYLRTPESIEDLGDSGRAQAPLPFVFAIDRAQTFDPGGNLSPYVGASSEIGMAAYFGLFYDHRQALDTRLSSETGVTEVTLLDERTTGRVFTRPVMLPDAAAMAAFDTLEIDIEITCDDRNPFACSEWDRIADVQLCMNEDCSQRREIARWITPYWRVGRQRWAIDASPFLALLREGGTRSFFVELGPEWERATEWVARVELRFSTRGGEPLASGAELAFGGGAFDATYNMREPYRFTPPAGATRVELVTILSGHGQTDGDNCAEWCDHRHTFSVNGTALPAIMHEGSRIGAPRGCAVRASEGVVPGQWGNWAQSRAYWCPGLPVEARRTDITSMVRLGEENELTLRGALTSAEPRGGDIALSAYVVWYGAP